MPDRNPWTDAGIRWGEKMIKEDEEAEKATGPDIGEEAVDPGEYRKRLAHKGFYMKELETIEGMKRVMAAKKGEKK